MSNKQSLHIAFIKANDRKIRSVGSARPGGFTLIEVLIVVSIITLIYFMTSEMITTGIRSSRFESEQATAVDYARRSMNTVTTDIRGANTSERGDYPIALAEDDQLTFYNDTNDDDIMEKIRYYRSGTNLIREIYLPGPLRDYSVFSASSTIAAYVNNQTAPIFSYFDADSQPTDVINQIRMINTYIMINVTPAIAPNDFILESDVNLRNLKDY